MIHLTEEHYAEIGRVMVESCTLDREVREYLTRLGAPPSSRTMLRRKLDQLEKKLGSVSVNVQGQVDFDFTLRKIRDLIDQRNALAHGVWEPDPTPAAKVASTARSRNASVHASEIEAVASGLRVARKLLLRLCHEYCPVAAGHKKSPTASVPKLKKQLNG